MSGSTVLLVDCGDDPMDLLAARIQRLGHRALRVKTPTDAYMALSNARLGIGAAILPVDAPVGTLDGALAKLREVAAEPTLSLLAHGTRPGPTGQAELDRAGFDLALYEPMDAHALRFQLNRALAWRHSRQTRRATRAPSVAEVKLRASRRAKEGRLYTVSPGGCFVAISTPWLRGTPVKLDIEWSDGRRLRAQGRVAMTNVRGNLMKEALPVGMGIALEKIHGDAATEIMEFVQRRLRKLDVAGSLR